MTKKQEFSPTFFHKVLTGNGGNRGLLTQSLNPTNDTVYPNKLDHNFIRKNLKKITNNQFEYYHIPFTNIVTETENDLIDFATIILSYDSAKDVFKMVEQNDQTLYSIPVNATFTKSSSKKFPSTFKVTYLNTVNNKNGNIQLAYLSELPQNKVPKSEVENTQELTYSLYNAITKMSELMQVHFADITSLYITNLINRGVENPFKSIVNLEEFDLTFEQYSELYEQIKIWSSKCSKHQIDILEEYKLSNTNILMLDSVNNLIKDKELHAKIEDHNKDIKLASYLSEQQLEAATTHEPFVLVQAGAGTGKSTTIIQRFEYMKESGIDPNKIRILSLTNAAADNIIEKNEEIQSTTIASYINNIYKLNFDKQNIVDFNTLKNTIMIYAGHNPHAREFRNLLSDKDNMKLLIFIRDHIDEVIKILNETEQTTLQIQSYICYIKADELNYGDDETNHFIVDETQDNNVFEFIYLMKLATLRKASVYIVGDASQTLYEFRGASAQALNAIETSGAFECIKLDTNYRSNQYILDFANVTLADIDVNRFAQIQLHSNKRPDMNRGDFMKTVQIETIEVGVLKDFEENFDDFMTVKATSYIDNKLENNEKVVLLARKGADVSKLQNWAEKQYPDKIVLNLVPKRAYSSDLFSNYVRMCWNDLILTPKSDILTAIVNDIEAKLVTIYKSRTEMMQTPSQYQISDWLNGESKSVLFIQNMYRAGKISHQEMMNKVRDNMIKYEIKNNAIRQSLLRQEQDDIDKEEMIKRANILVSTVHSVKGLEFDNVVFLHRNSNTDNEEEKRIDYVALTRAKETELVIDVYTKKNFSKLEMNYNGLLDTY